MNIKEMNVIASDVEKALSAICGAFSWKSSPQGVEYWIEVVANLHAIRKAAIEYKEMEE